jgi:hypothetical protein
MAKKGVPLTAAHKDAIRQSKLGVKRKPFTDPHRSNISAGLKRLKKPPFTEEHRKRLSLPDQEGSLRSQ